MSPAPGYQHGIVNGNIYTFIKTGLRGSMCLVTIENLDFRYNPEENDDYVCPDIMLICDRKHLKGGTYSGVPKFITETEICLKAFPHIKMTLSEIFEGID